VPRNAVKFGRVIPYACPQANLGAEKLKASIGTPFGAPSVAQVPFQVSENLLGIAQVGCIKTFSELVIH